MSVFPKASQRLIFCTFYLHASPNTRRTFPCHMASISDTVSPAFFSACARRGIRAGVPISKFPVMPSKSLPIWEDPGEISPKPLLSAVIWTGTSARKDGRTGEKPGRKSCAAMWSMTMQAPVPVPREGLPSAGS